MLVVFNESLHFRGGGSIERVRERFASLGVSMKGQTLHWSCMACAGVGGKLVHFLGKYRLFLFVLPFKMDDLGLVVLDEFVNS